MVLRPIFRVQPERTPDCQVLLNPLGARQTGAGECTITINAAAIGNAVFDATGARLRQVPFTPTRVLAALAVRG